MADLAILGIALAATTLVLRLCREVRDPTTILAVLPALALGSLSLAAFGLLFVGVDMSPLSLAPAFAGVLLYLVAVTRLWHRAGAHDTPGPSTGPQRLSAPLPSIAWILLGLTALFTLWAGWRWIDAWPHGSADAVNIWTSRALLLVRADGNIPARLALMSEGHPDYPLLLPAALAAQFAATQAESLVIPQATSVLWLIGLLATTFAVTSRLTDTLVGALTTLAVATNPLLIRWAFVQCADVPLAYLLLLGAGGMALTADGREGLFSPPLAGFFVGLLLWAKAEGSVLAVIVIGLAAAHGLSGRSTVRDRGRRATFFALGMAPPLSAFLLFRIVWTRNVVTPAFVRADWLERVSDPERWRLLLSTGAYEAFFPGRMNVSAALTLCLVVAVIAVLVVRRRATPAATWFLFAVPAAAALIYTTAYLLSPYDLQWHVSTSIDRLLLQVMPTIVVGAALVFATTPDRRSTALPPADTQSLRADRRST